MLLFEKNMRNSKPYKLQHLRLCRVCRLSRGVERVELEWSEYVGVLNKWACAPH